MRKVAVVAVHGVAYHAPGASANAAVDLLHSIPPGSPKNPAPYDEFQAETIHIPLKPLQVQPFAKPPTTLTKLLDSFQARSTGFAKYLQLQRPKTTPSPDVGHDFMRLQLEKYGGGAHGNTYVTTRLKGERAATEPDNETEVHVYEAYWADLARPKNTLLSFFFALLQLLLHLGSLSRLAIHTGALENPRGVWPWFGRFQGYAVWMLQLPIPLLNLILLIATFSVLPLQISEEKGNLNWWVAKILGGLLGTGFAFWWSRKREAPKGLWGWVAVPASGFVIGFVIAWLPARQLPPRFVTSVEWWILGGLLLWYVLSKYEKNVRAGSRWVGVALYVISLTGFLALFVEAHQQNSNPTISVTYTTLWTIQWLLAALRVSWMLLFGFGIVACFLGCCAWRRWPKGRSEQARARTAVRTSRLGLAVPSLLMLLMFIFLWGGLFKWVYGTPLFPHELFAADMQVTLPPGLNWFKSALPWPAVARALLVDPDDLARVLPSADACSMTPENYFKCALVWGAGPGLAFAIVVTTLAFFLLLWMVLPSVLSEKFPLRNEQVPPRSSTNGESRRMGQWLSRGLDATKIVTVLLWCAVFLVIAGFDFFLVLQSFNLQPLNEWTLSIVLWIGGLVGSLTALGLVVRYSSAALGIVLDVDSYLRTSPETATPRAKIVERYVSLLRYIAGNEHGERYSSVIILAHSLGGLISADLLKFLHENRAEDENLQSPGYRLGENLQSLGYGPPGGIPITLFTMGNPLRQLLNRFFPYLYQWVRDTPDGTSNKLSTVPKIPVGALPNPSELGVSRWVNAYRSGDYVGRALWLDGWYTRNGSDDAGGGPNQPVDIFTDDVVPPTRCEMCIGAGAHQHYWDDTAPDIARQLDALIMT